MEIDVTILIFAAVLAIGSLLVFLMRRKGVESGSAAELKVLLKQMEAQNRELSGRLTQIADDGRKSQMELAKVLQDRLDQVSRRMGQSLENSATKTAETIGQVKTHLKVIDEAQKKMKELSGNIMGLQNILDNKQARGAFGEQQLNDLVSSMLPPATYSLQAKLSNGKRADCLICLPYPPGDIAIDAKFPLEAYRRLGAAEEIASQKEAKAAFRTDVLKHINDIAERYIIPGETAEFALMFLPSEAVYAELHGNFSAVVDEAFKARVYIVSPSTMMATLVTARAIFKDVRMREQAGLIQKEVGALFSNVERLNKRVTKLSRHFRLAEEDVHEIEVSTGKIARHVERIEAVQLKDDSAGEGLEKIARPRLVEDKG